MSRWIPRIAVALALAAGAVALRLTVLAPKPVGVQVVRVERGMVEETVTNSKVGTVEARRRVDLSPEVSGIVQEIPREEGERARAGETLLRLRDGVQRAQVELAERSLDAANALHTQACVTTERARRELERGRKLLEDRVLSIDDVEGRQSAYDLATAGCEAAQAGIEKARAAVELARVELEMTIVRAPFEGIVAEISTEIGAWVTPSPPIVNVPGVIDLIDTASLYVSAPMDEVDLGRIQVGQAARLTLDPWPGRRFPGRVHAMAAYVLDAEKQNRTVDVEVELEDQAFAAQLLPGTSADVEIVLETRSETLRIPTGALIEGSRVLVLEGNRIVERPVEPGLANWDWTEIRSGLDEGALVVVSLDRAGVIAGARAVAQEAPVP